MSTQWLVTMDTYSHFYLQSLNQSLRAGEGING